MDEDIAVVNQSKRIELIKNFLKNNSKKILTLIIIVLIILISLFTFNEIKERKKNKLAEAYNSIIFNPDKYSKTEMKIKMLEIVNEKVETYSTLALYYLLDKKLIEDHNEMKNLFNVIIPINKDPEIRNLVKNILKKLCISLINFLKMSF